jgi:hypothetical protein
MYGATIKNPVIITTCLYADYRKQQNKERKASAFH